MKSQIDSSTCYFLQDLFANKFESKFSDTEHEHLNLISRYISIVKLIRIFHDKRLGIRAVYFFDDDLFDFNVIKQLPLKYALKIFFTAYIFKGLLRRMFDEFWVSSPYLQKKYSYLNPKLITPHQISDSSQNRHKIIVCYHGSASHIKEIKWLFEIISEVQTKTDNVHFEIFGTATVNKLFRNIPRVSVLHPMSWENYLSYTFSHKADIGLAPLLDTKFNLGRSPVKFFDYARMGAVGIYTNNDVYNKLVKHNKNGILLINNQETWVKNIIDLSSNLKKLNQLKFEVKKSAVKHDDGI